MKRVYSVWLPSIKWLPSGWDVFFNIEPISSQCYLVIHLFFWRNLINLLAFKMLKFLKFLKFLRSCLFSWKEEVPFYSNSKSNIFIFRWKEGYFCYMFSLKKITLFPHLKLKIFDCGGSATPASFTLYITFMCWRSIVSKI